MKRNCKKCNKEFIVRAGRETTSFWCSKTCFYSGYEYSDETREKMRTSHLGISIKRYPFIVHNGYKMLHKPEHPNSNKQGYVFEHRFVMSNHINRPLTKKEVVHHKDENPLNNDISNLELCESAGMHTKNHHPKVMENLRLSVIGLVPKNKNRGIKKCLFCQIEFEANLGKNGNTFCSKKCAHSSIKGVKPKNMEGLKFGRGWNKGIPAIWVKKGKEHHNYKHGKFCR